MQRLEYAGYLLRSLHESGVYSVAHNERKKYRAKGRIYHYRAMANDKIRSRSEVNSRFAELP